jgi:phosphate transport system substrate-binding protein
MKSFIALLTVFFALSTEASVIRGAGATFPAPLYTKWCDVFSQANQKTKVDYQSLGSGAGVSNFLKGTVQFGASDAPLTQTQEAEAKEKKIEPLHIPTVLGAVVITYNVPDYKGTLKLTSENVADIFRGKITTWNDAKLLKNNPELKTNTSKISVVYRADGSGTTAIFTDYLSKVSPQWKAEVGQGSSVKWPVGQGGRGNENLAQTVSTTPGSISYVELVYALNKNLTYAEIENKSKKFVKASVEAVTDAARGMLPELKKDIRTSITNASGKTAYPISGITYLLVAKSQQKDTGAELVSFIKWALSDGQKLAPEIHYAPLPESLAKKALSTVDSIKLN